VQFTLSEKLSNPERVESRRAAKGVTSQPGPGSAVGGAARGDGSGTPGELSGFERTLK
jgi:hypothetical protein